MTVTEAAQFLAVRPEKVRRLLREGMLLGDRHTCGLGWRVTRRYVEQLAEQRWHRLE
jgi:excisionase family DNA binding protein